MQTWYENCWDQVEKRDLVLTAKALFLLGRQKVKDGPNKGALVPAVSRAVELAKIAKVGGGRWYRW